MRIAIADNNNLKFCRDIKEHWENKGHEVRFERGASEFLAQWADLYYVDFWDNNIHYLYKLYHGMHDEMPKDWDNTKKPIIAVRAIDWEVWCGQARDQNIINWVNHVICIAPHIHKKLLAESSYRDGQLIQIRPGVNLDKFTFKTTETDGYQIGMALGDMWWYKNHMGGLDIFTQLSRRDSRWRLHIRGQHEGGEYNPAMYEYYLSSRGIRDKVTLYPPQDDMNQWYEKIDYLLHPGMKEAYCYAVGEAMAKGIKPIINNFYGSKDIWPSDLLYNTHAEASQMVSHGRPIKPSMIYRDYIAEHHNVKTMLKNIDSFLGT
jgi:glycosyltransferase involved in cell wall biosynthesis